MIECNPTMKPKSTIEAAGLMLSTDFDNGALARASGAGENELDLWPFLEDEYSEGFIKIPQPGGKAGPVQSANFAFHFRLGGCKDKTLTLKFHIASERSVPEAVSVVYANPDFPVFSYDGAQWQRAENKELIAGAGGPNEKVVVVRQTFTEDKVWVAYQYPYTNDHVSRLIQRVKHSEFCNVSMAGQSTEGRLIHQFSLTDFTIPVESKKVIWLTGLQHCAELGAGWGLEGMIEFLVSADPAAAALRQRFKFKIIPIVNVDAVAEGRGRIHSSGKNPNREWESHDPMREVQTIRATMDKWVNGGKRIDALIDIHGFSVREGKWTAPVVPKTSYPAERAHSYDGFLGAIKQCLPGIKYGDYVSEGFVSGMAARRYGALALAIDGYVYKWPGEAAPDFTSHYKDGCRIWDLCSIKATGAEFARAFLDWQ